MPPPSSPPAPYDGDYDLDVFPAFKESGHFFLSRNGRRAKDWQTVVILGTGRSGTTMTAGVLMLLDVEFGDRTDQRLGDRDISGCFREVYRSRLKWKVLTLRSRFARVLRARRARWGRFGFKSPDLAPFLPLLMGTLRRPVFIVATRNVFASSFGFARHVGGGWRLSYFTVTFLQAVLTLFTLFTRRPVLTFAYETATKDPARFVDTLCGFLGLDPTPEARQRAIDHIDPASGYSMLRRTNGHVDIAEPGRIAGWVADATRLDRGTEIAISDGDGVLRTVMADLPRPDVVAAGFHRSGACGFDVAFDPPLAPEQAADLRVTVAATGHTVWSKRTGNI